MAILHFLNTVAIYRKPSVCCGEKRKAMIGVLDSLCCMVMVLVCSNRADVARSSTPARLIISTPFMIFSIHGWAGKLSGIAASATRRVWRACGVALFKNSSCNQPVCCLAVPFGGFRLSADIFLHLLNLQVYLFTKLQIQGVHSWPIISTALLAFVTCTLMPVMLNVVFEANIRANYLARRNLSSQHLGTFWHWLRQRGIAHNAQA